MATITGTEWDEVLSGTAGADTISGGLGRDTIYGGIGNDSVDGGEGDDDIAVAVATGPVADNALTATGGAGQDTYRFLSADGAWGLTVTDFAAGAVGDRIDLWNLLEYSGSHGFLDGNPFSAGNGFLRLVQSGADTLLQYDEDGANGTLYGWHTAATLRNVDAAALVAENFLGVAPDGSPVPGEVFTGTEIRDFLHGGGFDDTLLGGAGSDFLSGNGGNDRIEGGDEEGPGDDIDGGAGHDTLLGGAGNDTLRGGSGDDYVDGGDGNDVMFLAAGDGNDTLAGGAGNDSLQVSPMGFNGPQAVEVQGGDGDDAISMGALVDGTQTVLASGGAGQDTYYFQNGDSARGLTITDFEAGAGGDRIGLEGLLDYSANQIGAYEGGNPFSPDQGYVRVVQDGANTLLQYDEDGAAGGAYGWRTAAVLLDVDASTLTADNFEAFSPDGAAIEGREYAGTDAADYLVGWWGDDSMLGGLGDDLLDGQTGADLLEGGDGSDMLLGYIGDDTLLGGAGNDRLEGEVGNDSLDGGGGNDMLVSAFGGNDTLVGGEGNDYFEIAIDGSGTAKATGGAGRDLYFFTFGTGSKGLTVTDFATGAGGDLVDLSRLLDYSTQFGGFQGGNPLSPASGYLRLVGSGADTLLQQDEDGAAGNSFGWHTVMRLRNVAPGEITADNFRPITRTGEASADRLLGGLGHDTLSGAGGDDTIDGGWGFDSMSGGSGNDTYVVDAAGDFARELAGEGVDTVRASVDWRLDVNVENLVLGAGALRGTGNTQANAITGNAAANVLDGGRGRDTLAGGAGNDEYRVDTAGDKVVESAGAGTDLVVSTATAYALGENVENGRIAASGTASLAGNALANVLMGGSGANRLSGGAGADVLAGGRGADVLAGGAGRDVFDFNASAESMVLASGRDTISDFIGGRVGDRIDLSGIDANARTAANDAFTFIGSKAFSSTNAAGQLRYEYDSTTGVGMLYGSTDADRTAEFAIEVTGVAKLAATDLIL